MLFALNCVHIERFVPGFLLLEIPSRPYPLTTDWANQQLRLLYIIPAE